MAASAVSNIAKGCEPALNCQLHFGPQRIVGPLNDWYFLYTCQMIRFGPIGEASLRRPTAYSPGATLTGKTVHTSSASEIEESRTASRTRLRLAATISFGSAVRSTVIRDLSSCGAQLEGRDLPESGTTVVIVRGSLREQGMLVWRDHQRAGVRFDSPLDLCKWLPNQAKAGQAVVDRRVAELRAGEAPLEDKGSDRQPHQVLQARLAEELDFVSRMLNSLGDDLAGEPLVVARHLANLQSLDTSTQILGHIAAILVAERTEEVVQAIGMESLRRRLQRVGL